MMQSNWIVRNRKNVGKINKEKKNYQWEIRKGINLKKNKDVERLWNQKKKERKGWIRQSK